MDSRFNFALIGLALVLFAMNTTGATVKGTAFEWYTLEPLAGVIIDVNSVPQQRFITQETGTYEFELGQGSYKLRAEFYAGEKLEYLEEQEITIEKEGEFNIDLIMFPLLEDPEEIENGFELGIELLEEPKTETHEQVQEEPDYTLSVLFVAIFGIFFGYFFIKNKHRFGKNKETQTKTKSGQAEELDEYAQEVIDVLKRSGNRLTQKELREKITSIGEAKISLIISELEAAGKIKKIKKGRGNIIVLKE